MRNKDGEKQKRKMDLYITNCITCESYYRHSSMVSVRRNGVTLKFGKIYCLFPKKAIKLDARKRHIEIPDDCPRYGVPVRFSVYTLKKKIPAANNAAGNASRYWRVYTGNLNMITHEFLFTDGSYTALDSKDGSLWDCDTNIHRLQKNDVVVREDGFIIQAWQWNGKYFESRAYFDESGIKKIPSRKGNGTV